MHVTTKQSLLCLICSPENKSGYFTRESTWKTMFSEFYNDLQSWEFPDDFKFGQKVYHYLNNDPDLLLGLCPECGRRCRFLTSAVGYCHFCSSKCASNSSNVREKYKETCLERYGCECSSQSKEVKKKAKQTCLDRYGCENPSQSEEIKERRKETYLERYGVDHYSQTDEYKAKVKETCLERYGVENPLQNKEVQEKRKQTCLEKYGCEYSLQNKEVQEKRKQTCLEKYGVEYVFQNKEIQEKYKETCLERYGVENPLQNKGIQEKAKQTCLERYGTEYPSQTDEWREKTRETCLSKYGAENYAMTDEFKRKFDDHEWVKSINEKCYQTKKKNHSFNSSKIEDQLREYFDLNDINHIYQYKSDLYPFNCDFYFPDKDLYVEIQGSWAHGGHPFTGSEEDLSMIETWENKGTEYYRNAVDVWTIRDVKKRETAKKNRLNWVEIFSCDLETCLDEIMNHI